MDTTGIIDSKTSPTLQWLNFLMNEMSTEDLISEATKHNKIIAEAVAQGDKDGIAGALSYWRALFMEALERRDKVAYHRWMTRVLNDSIDPMPFFIEPQKKGQSSEKETGPEGALAGGGFTQSNIRLAPNGDVVIAVLQRGHVVVGQYSQNGMIGRLENAAVVCRWGTSDGLGELAMKGPLPEGAKNGPTVLDKCTPVSFHVREVIMLMEVNHDAWRSICN